MTELKLTNLMDQQAAVAGQIPPERVRSITVEALVDTGATQLVLPADVVERLGVPVLGRRRVRYANGSEEDLPWVGGFLVEILGRLMAGEALVVPAGQAALIGQIPLENLDLVVDPNSREARVNPRSPDIPLLDLL